MTDGEDRTAAARGALLEVITGSVGHRVETFEEAVEDFQDSSQEWRRLFSELLGTFFLVMVAAGGGMMGAAFPNTISRTAAVVAPGLMVPGNAWLIMPPPAATRTRKNVPSNSENRRRHSCDESWKSWTVSSNVVSRRPKNS